MNGDFLVGFILGIFAGAPVGLLTFALLSAAKAADEHIKRMMSEQSGSEQG